MRDARVAVQGGEIMSERKRFERLSRYFAGLSFAQRQAATILVIVIVATAIWFGGGNGAGRSSRAGAGAAAAMEPLLDQQFNDADVTSITPRLTARRIPHEPRAGKIYRPSDQQPDAP